MVRVFAASVLALALSAGAALAQHADRPDVKVGDQWRFVVSYGMPSTEPNRAWVVNAITPAGIEGTENGRPSGAELSARGRAVVKAVSRNPYLGTSTVELVELQLRP